MHKISAAWPQVQALAGFGRSDTRSFPKSSIQQDALNHKGSQYGLVKLRVLEAASALLRVAG